jgi:hypothetical protein
MSGFRADSRLASGKPTLMLFFQGWRFSGPVFLELEENPSDSCRASTLLAVKEI